MHASYIYKESDFGGTGLKSPSDIKSSFQPVFRSGSCAEKGPKQFMEDVHMCVDNLPRHLGEFAAFPSPRAFYGVSWILKCILIFMS